MAQFPTIVSLTIESLTIEEGFALTIDELQSNESPNRQ